MSVVLVVNSGSSSFKYQLIDMSTESVLASGLVERIGQADGRARHTVTAAAFGGSDAAAPTVLDATTERELPIADHAAGFAVMLEAFAESGPSLTERPPLAVGHRVVHGGARFFEPTLITPLVEINIDDLSMLAPLHNPGAVQGIRAARAAFPDIPHVAVFDTAFHQTMPPEAYTYAIDRDLADRYRLRKYGFHGTSHKFVSEAAAAFVGRPLRDLRQIVFHLGNGASVTAIDRGRSVDTSMGFTPLEGLVMGTRSGDLDPAVLLQLARRARMTTDELDDLLNKKSGLVGLAGASDMRDILARVEQGEDAAVLAFDVYIHRLRAYAGAYLAQLGGADVISFTAGVGENVPVVRAQALATLGYAGVLIDPVRNAARGRGIRVISAEDSPVTVLVVPTNEELEIARQTLQVART
ncbi:MULTISPECIES: acetate/propionate family kinase [Microbacterium]|jgi:acetate kinase|uniref:acetate/propionate family kinase n=1 Tax=Microbacterium TaxID=33882 RepID=UPI0006F6CBBF|nr:MULTISPECIES: acetate kinase [unclassified Microbacterium]MBN9198162.1 acetate kinase [Microbacterium ginsengisoli]MCK9915378.1 acetate kinase [Microbacteriaceae bacterium K1510]KQR91038.1 acetate kinase [Microbacterium sp. Leaf351]KQR95947.1 acetate kinase [Microbacterium sp. Leaf347]OJU78459.1 MAG: acetate kinase [Microbacterium sp. 71-23]